MDLEFIAGNGATDRSWSPDPSRPLAGIRVLDLTRVLAGPVATRFLAGYGAEVLRIDPPSWDEAVASETTLGKRCAILDAKSESGLSTLKTLLAGADVLVHGYRRGALEGLGLGADARAAIRPGLIDVSLDAYGWSGPWRDRRGFDSLVQMSIGIADAGREWARSEKPIPLPFQALDQATGYLMAAVAVRGLTRRLQDGHGMRARASLARTGLLLLDEAHDVAVGPALDLERVPTSNEIEETPWGRAKRVRPPLKIDGAPLRWDSPACALGSGPACWASTDRADRQGCF
jgi:crotonobetainyl-CoA:carnitine CoA-transferase CaiB-like acyl-CoA transferase